MRREDGRPVDPPYLNAVEHDHRYPPEDFLIEQLAKIVGIPADSTKSARADRSRLHGSPLGFRLPVPTDDIIRMIENETKGSRHVRGPTRRAGRLHGFLS